MTKHGWKMLFLENANYIMKPPENRRASHFYGLREPQKLADAQ